MCITLNAIAAAALCGAVTIALTIDHQTTVAVEGSSRKPFAAVAFDYLVLFNPDSVMSAVEEVSPGRGRIPRTP